MKWVLAPILAVSLVFGTAIAEESTAELALRYLEYIGTELTDRNVMPVGAQQEAGSAHEAAREWIISELKGAGYTDEQIVCETMEEKSLYDETMYPIRNIVLTVDGRDTSRQVIVGAHYDGDGVGDNGSGVALLLSTAVRLAGQQPLYTVRYVFFDGEEVGLVGAGRYAAAMSDEETASTVYMVNIDSVAFGDYCNIYGGVQDDSTQTVTQTEAYELAVEKARAIGICVMTPEELDGYFAEHGEGPAIEENTLYTNPWTYANPAPSNGGCVAPTTGDWSDHADFKERGIPYIYMEATNWYATGDEGEDAYTGYFETTDTSVGYYGMFMNTEYDTLEMLNTLFPGRAKAHFEVFCPLLCSLVMDPASATA